MKKKDTFYYTVIAIILFNYNNYCQSNKFLDEFEQKKISEIDSITHTLKNQQKKLWLNLLPSFNYDLYNQSFNIGISFNSLASFYQRKKRNKIELAKLRESKLIRLDNYIEKLELKIEAFEIDYIIAKNKIELFKIESNLFLISQGKYANNEITSEDFLILKLAYLNKLNSLKTTVLKLKLKAKYISLKTKNDFRKKSLFNLSNLINNL